MPSAPPVPDFAPIATERLVLRPFAPGDAAELHNLMNHWEVCRDLAEVPFPYPHDVAVSWVGFTREAIAAGRAWHLAITRHEGEREILVGGVGLRLDEDGKAAKLGYWVGLNFWGQGVAREAAGRMARWALANLDIERVHASVATSNAASQAVLRRIGLRHVGAGEEMFTARGDVVKVLHFEANRTDLFGAPEVEARTDGGKPLVLVAACALVDRDGRILLARRPEGKKMAGLWEFPGGKLNPGETPEAALIRELKEELGIDVASNCLAAFTFASHEYDSFHLLMPLYLCRRWKGTPTGRENQQLAWVRPDKLAEYPMPAADRPLVPLLRDFL
ncbi:MAG: bifunctional GNAT family N-acetyltransferase/(deoxy)nucleoside triphosphate pyrophosphohydrolase [Alphaproteobacteria bacterium]|nr:bifunctional GNAT family N-acetyltransferase/(deoxy)nucleoside triphosphate pyrophosphohydrolase [Alphaproteobacteria bacterium]